MDAPSASKMKKTLPRKSKCVLLVGQERDSQKRQLGFIYQIKIIGITKIHTIAVRYQTCLLKRRMFWQNHRWIEQIVAFYDYHPSVVCHA